MSSYEWNGFNLKSRHQYTLSSRTRSYQLLPSPYSTDCYDYSQSSLFRSRKDCVRKCKLKDVIDKCGHIYRDIDIYEGEANVTFSHSEDDHHCVPNFNLNEFCLKICPKNNCFEQHMEFFVLEDLEMGNNDYLTNRVSLYIPLEPKTTFYHKPSLEIIEFFSYLGSTLSLWLSFSMITFLFGLRDMININLHKNFVISNHMVQPQRLSSSVVQRF